MRSFRTFKVLSAALICAGLLADLGSAKASAPAYLCQGQLVPAENVLTLTDASPSASFQGTDANEVVWVGLYGDESYVRASVDLGAGDDLLCADADYAYDGQLKVIAGPGDDTVRGTGPAQAPKMTVLGGAGRDRITSGKGKDRLDGGSGHDFCDGGRGKDSATSCEIARNIP